MAVCKGYQRHWYVTRDGSGEQLEKCIRCGKKNPKWKAAEQSVEPTISWEARLARAKARKSKVNQPA